MNLPREAIQRLAVDEVARRLDLLDRAWATRFRFRPRRIPCLTCERCGGEIGSITAGDTLGGLLNDLRDHVCTPRPADRTGVGDG